MTHKTYHGLIPEGYTIQVIRDENAWMDAAVESDKWRNISFNKNGKSHLGVQLHPTENEAKLRIDIVEAGMVSGLYKGITTLDGRLDAKEYSHTIQMPVKE